jgi:hypothetical protein
MGVRSCFLPIPSAACLSRDAKAGQKWSDARRPPNRGARRIETYVERRGARATPQMAVFHQPTSLFLKP